MIFNTNKSALKTKKEKEVKKKDQAYKTKKRGRRTLLRKTKKNSYPNHINFQSPSVIYFLVF